MAFITVAGEQLIALKQGNSEVLDVSHFVLAYIEGLGEEPSDRVEALPASSDIKATLAVTKQGYVNENQVVYSLVMDSTIGDFTFNWVGLKTAEGTLLAVSYITPIEKLATAGSVPGNNITRNFLVAFSGIQTTTAIDVDAETWQIDFTTRLVQIDERERLSNFDVYGAAAFFGDGFKVTHTSGGNFSIAAGLGYVGGLRCYKSVATAINVMGLPKSVWLDVALQGDINGKTEVIKFTKASINLTNYTDANGFDHYVTKLCDIATGNVVTDRRRLVVNLADLQNNDPFPQYLTENEANGLYEPLGVFLAHTEALDPHSQYLTQDEANELYKAIGYQAFVSGTRLTFHNATAPTGWTKITTFNDAALRVVSGNGGGSGGSVNFSTAFTHSHNNNLAVSAHALTVNEMPVHSHGYVDRYHRENNIGDLDAGGTGIGSHSTDSDNNKFSTVNATTGNTGSGDAHPHNLTGSITSVTISPKYIDVILCVKD